MKKKLLLFAMGLFALAGNTMAKSDIYYKVDKVDIMPGKTAAITLMYDADADAVFKGFQVEFILPEGFTQAPGAKLGAELASHNPELQLRTSERDDGNPRPTNVFMGFQIDLTEFPVGEGIELFTFYVKCDEDVELGEYPFTTTHLEFADMKTGQSFHCTPKTCTLNVIEYAPRVISEEDTEVAEASTEPEEVTVKRTIKANTWSTLTLPFSLTADQVTEVFGDDVQIAEFVDYEKTDDGKFIMNFESLETSYGLDANYPYILKTTKAIDKFTVKDVEVNADEENATIDYDNGKSGNRRVVYATMYGTLHNGITVPNNCFFLRNNNFYVSNGSSVLQGLRAYFEIIGYQFFGEESANISFAIDGETTAIEGVSVNGSEIVSGDVYSVNGTFMGRAENVMKSLPRGIYIVNNKKVVVK
jgi:hypothetical protein